jgi:hypothetical protein
MMMEALLPKIETPPPHGHYERLVEKARGLKPVTTAVAHSCYESSLRGAVEAADNALVAQRNKCYIFRFNSGDLNLILSAGGDAKSHRSPNNKSALLGEFDSFCKRGE